MLRKILGFVALAAVSSAANATFVPATWTDSVTGTAYVSTTHSHTYTHDITDGAGGFNAGSDLALAFDLDLNIYDDANDRWWELESGNIEIGGYESLSFNFLGLGGIGAYIAGLAQLNDLGTLTVTINSNFGDFMFGGSDLTVAGLRNTATSVPEPATLGLMGLGLLGVGFSARRKAAKN